MISNSNTQQGRHNTRPTKPQNHKTMFYVISIRKQIDNGVVTNSNTCVLPTDGTPLIEDAENLMKDNAVKMRNSNPNFHYDIEDTGNQIVLRRNGKVAGRIIETTFKIVKDI